MSTVTIIGAAGTIGSNVAGALYGQRQFDTYRFVDPRTNVLEAMRIDLVEAAVAADVTPATIQTCGPEEADRNPEPSDLVVYAATVGESPGRSRSSFAELNWRLLSSLQSVVEQSAGETGSVLLITNPVDVMAELLCRASSRLRNEQVMGYSTNDSTRMRIGVAAALGVNPARVGAHALGVHGEQLVPIFSDIRVDGEPVELDSSQKARIVDDLATWLERWRVLESGRSSTWSTAAGAASLVTAMRRGDTKPVSLSTASVDFLPDDSHIAVPAALEEGWMRPARGMGFSAEERAELVRAAERVKALTDGLV